MNTHTLRQLIQENWWQVGLVLIGGALMITGIFLAQHETRGEALELVAVSSPSATTRSIVEVVVEVAGAVERPGLLRLVSGSRVGEAIVQAGGLSRKADRSWVSRFINQAEVIKDGVKIYIPEIGESSDDVSTNAQLSISNGVKVVSVNTASLSELDGLWGIGEARAQAIIDNRPYASLVELVTKAKLTQSILDKNTGKIGL